MRNALHGSAVPESFVTQLTEAQFSLFDYISFLLCDSSDARDVLQETNPDLWRKASAYDASRPFLPWARVIAHYQVLTFRKKQSRSHLLFDDEFLASVSAKPLDEDEEAFSRMAGFRIHARCQRLKTASLRRHSGGATVAHPGHLRFWHRVAGKQDGTRDSNFQRSR